MVKLHDGAEYAYRGEEPIVYVKVITRVDPQSREERFYAICGFRSGKKVEVRPMTDDMQEHLYPWEELEEAVDDMIAEFNRQQELTQS